MELTLKLQTLDDQPPNRITPRNVCSVCSTISGNLFDKQVSDRKSNIREDLNSWLSAILEAGVKDKTIPVVR